MVNKSSLKIVVCGEQNSGKTAMLLQAIYDLNAVGKESNGRKLLQPTIEDSYFADVELENERKIRVKFIDTQGLTENNIQLPKLLYAADAFILVYDVTKSSSFDLMWKIRRDIDSKKEKKEAPFVAVGTKCDLNTNKEVEFHLALEAAKREQIHLFEVSATQKSSLIDPISFLVRALQTPVKSSGFSLPVLKKPR